MEQLPELFGTDFSSSVGSNTQPDGRVLSPAGVGAAFVLVYLNYLCRKLSFPGWEDLFPWTSLFRQLPSIFFSSVLE